MTLARMDACPDAERLAACVDGTLDEREREQLIAHIGSCDACFEVYAGTSRFSLELESPRRPHLPSGALQWLGSAAALLVVLGAGVFFLGRGNSSLEREPELVDLSQSARSALDVLSKDLVRAGYGVPVHLAVVPNGDEAVISIVFAEPGEPVNVTACPAVEQCTPAEEIESLLAAAGEAVHVVQYRLKDGTLLRRDRPRQDRFLPVEKIESVEFVYGRGRQGEETRLTTDPSNPESWISRVRVTVTQSSDSSVVEPDLVRKTFSSTFALGNVEAALGREEHAGREPH